jgi:hypothetical protein
MITDVAKCQEHNPPYMPVHCVGCFSISYATFVPGDNFNQKSILQVALRAVVLQPGVLWFGSRDLVVVSTILPQALVQSGAGVESYSDASSGMATIMPNEV